MLKASSVPLYVHAPYLINVASANNRIRIPSRKILQDTCDAAAEINATAVIVHGGHADDNDMEAGFERWVKALAYLETDVQVYLENTAGGDHAMARYFDTIGRLWDHIGDSGIGFCLDTCHAWAAGEGLIDAVERIKALTGRIDLVHCNDSRDAAGSGADRHANFGTGQIDPDLLVAVVTAADAPVICETADAGPQGRHRVPARTNRRLTRRGPPLATLFGVVLLIAGCSAVQDWMLPTGFVAGTSIHHINIGGHDRSFRLYLPAGLPASAALVVMMHGYSATARQAEKSSKWDDTADSGKFVVAYPDGLDRAWNVNGGGCCGKPASEGVDDIGFIGAAVADIAKNAGIDPRKVYATGMSNGGIMSYTLACATDIFAAIGPVAGVQLNSVPSPRTRHRSCTFMAPPMRWCPTSAGRVSKG